MSFNWLFVGLGNPGAEYVRTRHNIGFMALDALSENSVDWKKKHNAWIGPMEIEGAQILLCKPLSYMNLSGGPVLEIIKQFHFSLDKVVVFHDELEIPFSETRWKLGGGHAGHNGLRHISSQCGSEYKRMRIGIGRPKSTVSISEFVLSNFTTQEMSELQKEVFSKLKGRVPLILQERDQELEQVLRNVEIHPTFPKIIS